MEELRRFSSERDTNRELILPRGGLGQQEIGNIQAGDEEEKSNCAEKHDERRPYGSRQFLSKAGNRSIGHVYIGRVLLMDLARDCGQFRMSL